MDKISPFLATFYRRSLLTDMPSLITPPYDVIIEKDQERYRKKSPYNIIRVILGKEKKADDLNENGYLRVKNLIDKWLREKVLEKRSEPAFYFYRQSYLLKGKRKERRGFIGLLSLRENNVFLHEETFEKPIEDRYKLISTCRGNFCPIFSLYRDKDENIEKIMEGEAFRKEPIFSFFDEEGVRHSLWEVRKGIEEIASSLTQREVFIADGHHRYQSARRYFEEKREESASFILTYFTNLSSPGLTILPVHRYVMTNLTLKEIRKRTEDFFLYEEMKGKEEMEESMPGLHRFGLFLENKYFLLSLREERVMDNLSLGDHSREWRRLDVVVLHELFIKKLLKIEKEMAAYFKDENVLLRKIKEDGGAGIFLNPLKAEELERVSRKGEVLPPKSTYFYPKIPSGLVAYLF